jgi:serine/threonine protein kinase
MDNTRSFVPISKGTMISHYKIIEKIGAGGMGEVHLAHDAKLDRRVALKFLSVDLCEDEGFRKRFIREARAAARLNHPNIVTVHEVGKFQNRPFISMAYIEGQPLHSYSAARNLSIEVVIELGIQICSGLAAAHKQCVTHRDLKPSNIIVDQSNSIHILDFGLAILEELGSAEDPGKTVTKLSSLGIAAGTVPYMAPEQLRGEKVSHLVDIFALGVILYELTCGDHPFGGSTVAEMASSILRDDSERISDKRIDTPYDLARIIGRCLQKNPDKRFQTAKDVRNELEELQEMKWQKSDLADAKTAAGAAAQALSEGKFTLNADLVRKLENRLPRMIGDRMTYLYNDVETDTLAIHLHGIGASQRTFSELLKKLPCRGVAPTLYGWDAQARYRPPLSLDDHSILLRGFLEHCNDQFHPRHIILTGYSSGADHILHLLSSDEGARIEINGLILLGCNLDLSTCFVTRAYVNITPGNSSQIFATYKRFGDGAKSLEEWVTVQDYLVQMVYKFGVNIEPIIRYSADILHPFETNESEQFIQWYRTVVKRIPIVRFVFSTDEFLALDRILGRHLEGNVLGKDYSEKTILREEMSHMQLKEPNIMLRHTLEVLKQIEP